MSWATLASVIIRCVSRQEPGHPSAGEEDQEDATRQDADPGGRNGQEIQGAEDNGQQGQHEAARIAVVLAVVVGRRREHARWDRGYLVDHERFLFVSVVGRIENADPHVRMKGEHVAGAVLVADDDADPWGIVRHVKHDAGLGQVVAHGEVGCSDIGFAL
jgi:hypothetical protein